MPAFAAFLLYLTGCAPPVGGPAVTHSDLDVLRRRPPEFTVFLVEATAICLEQGGLDGSVFRAFHEENAVRHASSYLNDPVSYSGLLPPLTPEAAAMSGYRTVLRPHPPADSEAPELPAGYSAALLDDSELIQIDVPGFGVIGAPTHGCVASSAELLFGSFADWLLADQFVVSGIRQYSGDALETSEVRTVAEAYAACMSESGYDVQNPAQAAQAARDRWVPAGTESDMPAEDEIEMAVADAECQAAHPVLRVAEEQTIELASEWIADNTPAILEAASAQRRALDLVRAGE